MSKLTLTEVEVSALVWKEWGARTTAHAMIPGRSPERTICGARTPPRGVFVKAFSASDCALCAEYIKRARTKSGVDTAAPMYSLTVTGNEETGYSIVRNGLEIARTFPGLSFDPAQPHIVKLFRDRWAILDERFSPIAAGEYIKGREPFPHL